MRKWQLIRWPENLILLLVYVTLYSFWQHDSGTECTPGESKNLGQKENGNYIMYARATSGDKLNNNKFSLCSIRNISQVLEKKRNNCFVGMYIFPPFYYEHIFFCLFFLGPHLWCMKIPRLGIELELQLQAYATAVWSEVWSFSYL